MKVYAAFDDPGMPLSAVPAYARRVERIGFAGLLVPEAVHDGFLTALLALEHTERIEVATSVALAFPRSPTAVAYSAWDLQAMSGGRFILGLGSQVKGNITRRFGVEWTPPVPRMRDYVAALRAVWQCWQTGDPIDFDSPSYRISRMQPFFNPGPIDHPDIPIYLGGVNRNMVRLAAEATCGLMTHPTNTTPRYLRERIVPELVAGAARRRDGSPGYEIIASTFIATGATPAEVREERERMREHFGFLYSTPQYRPTLDLHGFGDLGERLHALAREGRWGEMKAAVGDDVLDAMVPSAPYDEIATLVVDRYGDLVSAITLRMPDDAAHDAALGETIREIGRLTKEGP